MTSKTVRKMCVLAGLTVMAAVSQAALAPIDAQIMIDRALNSPTLTVRYSNASASIVELRLNGESIGTRSVSATKSSGETNFTIDLNQLRDGDNEVEIRLYDKTGKLVGSDKTNISTDQSSNGPVFLKTPKVGATLQNTAEINLGFGRELKNVYVSFFVDNNFKKMTNYPPYTFQWDTLQETNGWHEIEAWVIDESSTTYKTKKTRVFVNNPGGRTDRPGSRTEGTLKTNGLKSGVEGEATGMKALAMNTKGTASNSARGASAPATAGNVKPNRVKASLAGGMTGTKPLVTTAPVLATGTKNLAPTLVAKNQTVKAVSSATMNAVKSAATTLSITKGTKLPIKGTYSIVYNAEYVNFDVSPRVDAGVPMTPFRHLLEKAGGEVDWEKLSKTVKAKTDGKNIWLQVGDVNARIDQVVVSMEKAPYIENGRTIVPLSFMREVLKVDIEFDAETGHVLITSLK